MELDLSDTERSESTISKEPSPTAEKRNKFSLQPDVDSQQNDNSINGFHGNGFGDTVVGSVSSEHENTDDKEEAEDGDEEDVDELVDDAGPAERGIVKFSDSGDSPDTTPLTDHPTSNEESTHTTSTEEPTHTTSIEEPTHTIGTEEPTHTTGTEEPTHTTSIEESTHTTSTEEPSHTSGTEEPAYTASTEESTHTSGTAEPTHTTGTEEEPTHISTVESTHTTITEEPTHTARTEEGLTHISTVESTHTIRAEDEPIHTTSTVKETTHTTSTVKETTQFGDQIVVEHSVNTFASPSFEESGIGAGERQAGVGGDIVIPPDSQTYTANVSRDTAAPLSVDDADVASDGWVDLLGNGCLKKKVLTPGGGLSSRPGAGDTVTLSVSGQLQDGAIVDCHDNLQFSLGEGDVIPALDLGVAMMEEGEECQLETSAKYAYGSFGLEPDVPSGATIIYTLRLLRVQEALDNEQRTIDDRVKVGDAKRVRGNYYFSRNEHPQALACYTKALEILEPPPNAPSADTEQLQLLLDTKAKCYNNLAAAQIKIEAYDAAIKSCDAVLRVEPDNVKALFRKGKALGCKDNLEEAVAVLRKALKLEPESKLIHQELSRLVGEQRNQNDKQREMYKKMLGQDKVQVQPDDGANTSMVMLVSGLGAVLALLVGLYLYQQAWSQD